MDEAELGKRLFGAAERAAKQRGVRFGQGADGDIRFIADQAAREIAQLPAPEQKDKAAQAEHALERLVDAMVEATDEIPGYQKGIIGEKTLERAKIKLCPLWPIC